MFIECKLGIGCKNIFPSWVTNAEYFFKVCKFYSSFLKFIEWIKVLEKESWCKQVKEIYKSYVNIIVLRLDLKDSKFFDQLLLWDVIVIDRSRWRWDVPHLFETQKQTITNRTSELSCLLDDAYNRTGFKNCVWWEVAFCCFFFNRFIVCVMKLFENNVHIRVSCKSFDQSAPEDFKNRSSDRFDIYKYTYHNGSLMLAGGLTKYRGDLAAL